MAFREDALVQRYGQNARGPAKVVLDDRTWLDVERLTVCRNGMNVSLSVTQWLILRCLAKRLNQPVAVRELLRSVWGGCADASVLQKQVWRLRQALEPDPRRPRYIVTVRGQGYMLRGTERNA
ncbi:hypothetical protein GCM10010885_15990 [Alicyclobacillus cellulosilyticus]|uniref:OmpR/PhoB-type domain-containing protein n=1 Tax=Alicyclobacillus cellulosilyticus TaxID=1003997 RepID=A0A917NLZ0_9BACL|nr:winged helix-turn-helix domain-containing protein [Alicyclobacillus cellulosilyticus]GGJ07718.1 hypothetical protein GCM10010885_15990 [Alicyclobacillus cellulosilyticus]